MENKRITIEICPKVLSKLRTELMSKVMTFQDVGLGDEVLEKLVKALDADEKELVLKYK